MYVRGLVIIAIASLGILLMPEFSSAQSCVGASGNGGRCELPIPTSCPGIQEYSGDCADDYICCTPNIGGACTSQDSGNVGICGYTCSGSDVPETPDGACSGAYCCVPGSVGTPPSLDSFYLGEACTIAAGASTCEVMVSWKVANPSRPQVLHKETVFSIESVGTEFRAIDYGDNEFRVEDGSYLLLSQTAMGNCTSGSSWNGSICASTLPTCNALGGSCEVGPCSGTATVQSATGCNDDICCVPAATDVCAIRSGTCTPASGTCLSGQIDGVVCPDVTEKCCAPVINTCSPAGGTCTPASGTCDFGPFRDKTCSGANQMCCAPSGPSWTCNGDCKPLASACSSGAGSGTCPDSSLKCCAPSSGGGGSATCNGTCMAAATTCANGAGSGTCSNSGYKCCARPSSGGGTPPLPIITPTETSNPLSFTTVDDLFGKILSYLQTVIVTITLIFLLVGGIMYITSGGDSGRIETAKNIIFYALLGLAVAIAAPAFTKEIYTILGAVAPVVPGTTLSVIEIANNILNFLLSIVGIIAIIMLVVGALMYLTAAGDEDRIDTGKKIVKYSVIGIAIALGSLVLVSMIANFL